MQSLLVYDTDIQQAIDALADGDMSSAIQQLEAVLETAPPASYKPVKITAVGRYLDVSTIHVLPEVLLALENDWYDNIVAYPYPEGVWVYAHDDYGCIEGTEAIKLWPLFQYARSLGCDWIKLDADGMEHDELENFEDAWD